MMTELYFSKDFITELNLKQKLLLYVCQILLLFHGPLFCYTSIY